MRKILITAIAIVATGYSIGAFARSDTDVGRHGHPPLRFSPPQGKTCSAKCKYHVTETHENFDACMRRHCSKDSTEHW
jgi:hypothetical protein